MIDVCFSEFAIFSYFKNEKLLLHESNLGIGSNHQFSHKRLLDFSTGRYCAIKALEQIGIVNAFIPIGKDKEPLWPNGVVGSISHCESLIGAIVAKSTDHVSLGLDIEEIGKVTSELWDLVFTEKEKKYLSGLSENELLLKSTVIFSIKEAFYKFQHPLTKTFLDFLDVEVSLPFLNHLLVLSNEIANESIVRNNQSFYFVENDCVISVVIKNKLS